MKINGSIDVAERALKHLVMTLLDALEDDAVDALKECTDNHLLHFLTRKGDKDSNGRFSKVE